MTARCEPVVSPDSWLARMLAASNLTYGVFLTLFEAASEPLPDPSTLRRWRNGSPVKPRTVAKLSRVLSRDPEWVAGFFADQPVARDRRRAANLDHTPTRRAAAPRRPRQGTHPQVRTMQERAERRARFASWLSSTLSGKGVEPADQAAHLADRLGLGDRVATEWLSAQHLPPLETLERLAVVLGEPLPVVLHLAGKGRDPNARARHGVDPHGSLASVLRRWRDANHLDAPGAAERCFMSRFDWSRYVAGSKLPETGVQLMRLSLGTGISPAELAAACEVSPTGAPVDLAAALSECQAARGMVSEWMVRSGARFSDVAARAGIGLQSLKRSLDVSVPNRSPAVLAAVAKAIDADLCEFLVASGYDPVFAGRVAPAMERAAKLPSGSLGSLLRTARLAKGWSLAHVAAQAGYAHHAVLVRFERDVHVPPLEKLVKLCDLLDLRLAEACAAAGHAAIA